MPRQPQLRGEAVGEGERTRGDWLPFRPVTKNHLGIIQSRALYLQKAKQTRPPHTHPPSELFEGGEPVQHISTHAAQRFALHFLAARNAEGASLRCRAAGIIPPREWSNALMNEAPRSPHVNSTNVNPKINAFRFSDVSIRKNTGCHLEELEKK